MMRAMDAERRSRRLYAILTGIIVATLPCYCLGFLLAFSPLAPGPQQRVTATLPLTPTQILLTITSATTDTATPGVTDTLGGPTPTLQPTPTQFVPPTLTPTVTPSKAPTTPTTTPSVTSAFTATQTPDLVSTGVAGTQTAIVRQTQTQGAVSTAIAGTQTAVAQTLTALAPTLTPTSTATATQAATATPTMTSTATATPTAMPTVMNTPP